MKKHRTWLLTCVAFLCIAFLPSSPVFAAVGAYSGLGTSGTMIYHINNFTPYELRLTHTNASPRATPVLPLGIPGDIPGLPQLSSPRADYKEGAMAKTIAVYQSWQGDKDWEPEYKVMIPNEKYDQTLNILLQNNVTPKETLRTDLDQLNLAAKIFGIIGNVFRAVMKPGDIGNYVSLVSNIANAVKFNNTLIVVPGDLYVLGTSTAGYHPLVQNKNDVITNLVSNSDGSVKLVLQVLAVRFGDGPSYKGETFANTSYYEFTMKYKKSNFMVLNVYTLRQYEAANATYGAQQASAQNQDEQKLIDFLKKNDGTDAQKAFEKLTDEQGCEVLMAVQALLSEREKSNLPDTEKLYTYLQSKSSSNGMMHSRASHEFNQTRTSDHGFQLSGDVKRTTLVRRALDILGNSLQGTAFRTDTQSQTGSRPDSHHGKF